MIFRVHYPIEKESHSAIRAVVGSALDSHGAAVVQYPSAAPLLTIASVFGEPVAMRLHGPVLETLTTVDVGGGRPNSFSATYGRGMFPFHTDGAFQRLPPRYILMRLSGALSANQPTLVLNLKAMNLSEGERGALSYGVWLVKSAWGRFLAPILSFDKGSGSSLLRWDPRCMSPRHPAFTSSASVLNAVIARSFPIPIEWGSDTVLIIDNWAALHARGPPTGEPSERTLERVAVKAG